MSNWLRKESFVAVILSNGLKDIGLAPFPATAMSSKETAGCDNITIRKLESLYTYSSCTVSWPKAPFVAELLISVEHDLHKLTRRETVGGCRYLLYYVACV